MAQAITRRRAFCVSATLILMAELLEKLLEDVRKYFLVYLFILLALIFWIVFKRSLVGLTLFTFAIGVLVGQSMPKEK